MIRYKGRMFFFGVALCATASFLSAAASGEPPPVTKLNCDDSPSEKALLTCRNSQWNQSTTALKRLFSTLHSNYAKDEPERAELLAAAQAAWAAYRDAECRVRTYDSRQGTAYRVYELSCLTDINRQRIDDLSALIQSP